MTDAPAPHGSMPLRDDNPSEVDLLGFEDVVDVLEAIVTRPDLDPVTLGVNAPWGGGKTTVLHLLKQRLDARKDILCLLISPWEYDNKTDPTTALIDEVLGGVQQKLEDSQAFEEALGEKAKGLLRKLRRRVKFAKAMKLAASAVLTTTLPGVGALIDLFDDEAKTDDEDAPPDPTLQGFRRQFAELMVSEDLKSLQRVVVLVDDLDRSLPDTVVETLEAIKLFLSVKKMAFVVAADEDNVANAIGRRLATTGQPITSRLYLEKIVQVPVRVPGLTKEQTEEYLALLMLADMDGVGQALRRIKDSRPAACERLVERLGESLPADRRSQVHLAQQLTPLLHRHTSGNPRRLKRFLNAFWLRTSFAAARGIKLQPEALAKLMLAELHYPDLFGQLLSWLSAGTVAEKVKEIEDGKADLGAGVRDWGELPPNLSGEDLAKYLLLAASLRGETIEEAALPPELKDIASKLSSRSDVTRKAASKRALNLDTAQQVTLVRYLSISLRQQRSVEAQKALALSIAELRQAPGAAATAVEELRHMQHATVTAAVPIALGAGHDYDEFKGLLAEWRDSPEVSDMTRNAAKEALGQN